MRKFREWFSIQLAKYPGRIILLAILLFNVIFLVIAALIISALSLKGTEQMGFFEAAFYTVTMILDAGCIQFVVADIGTSGVVIALVCLVIIIIGMVSFTGAVIGYVTNYISNFIAESSSDSRRLRIANHFVILNWNSRASEIVNDLLYSHGRQKVVVLTSGRKKEIQREIDERISDTIHSENKQLFQECMKRSKLFGHIIYLGKRKKNTLTVIVREGEVFSMKCLRDIAIEKAKSIVILSEDTGSALCQYGNKEKIEEKGKGNAQTIKTLMLVSDITSADFSMDDQKIVVEISDDWTLELVNKIIKYKQVDGKCNIVPIRINQILGQLLSQFSLMPELNLVYKELFSNKGATFFAEERTVENENAYITEYLKSHKFAIPLTAMDDGDKHYVFYSSDAQKEISKVSAPVETEFKVKLNRNYWIERKNVVILGHNSKSKEIMQGFSAFCSEWQRANGDILRVSVIDDAESLERMNGYSDYPFVKRKIAASVYDKDLICSTIEEIIDENKEDTSILILSDDTAYNEKIDARALANLVYVQDIIAAKKEADPAFDVESVDIIVEILDPKHHDIVSRYSVNNVVISNRYISKMITQVGEKEAIFNFYSDILTYDTGETEEYSSKEIYTKKVSTFFEEIPGECTAAELIRGVWNASVSSDIPVAKQNPTVVLGYVKPGGRITLFEGDQTDIPVKLEKQDKLIVYTNH